MRDHVRAPAEGRSPGRVVAYDIETIAPEQPDGSFPPWPTHRIVAIGFAQTTFSGGQWAFDLDAQVGREPDDPTLIQEADKRMATAGVVTVYNSRGFDALCLRLAAQRKRLWGLKALSDHAAMPRFGAEHADLADLYASHNRKVSLASICNEIGIPVKTSVTGGEVGALWAAGEKKRIADYVLEDATATLVLYLAWSAARTADEALITRPMAALARHIESKPGLCHLQQFLDCALMRWARPRAMLADLGAAADRVTKRLQREDEERGFVPSS